MADEITQDLELPAKYQGRDDEDELKQRYKEMLFEPGEAAGIVGAQSISEPATQMTMETYHSAGAAKVSITLGLPRLIEIIDARRNPKTPVMNVYLDEDHNDQESAREIAAEIQAVKFQDVVSQDSFDIAQLELEFVLDEDVLDEFMIDHEDVKAKLDSKLKKANISLDDNVLRAYPDDDDYDLTDLQDMKKKAVDIRLQGIKGIDHVVLLEEEGEWRIQTAGTNLRKVMKIDGVDTSRTVSNDLFEVKKVLGVEAARNLVLREMQETLGEQGINVDVRWLMMMADTMTKDGDVQGATRYGITGSKNSVLARASFEETKKHLTDAALKGEVDPINSVVENLILGQVIPVGTGLLELKAEPGKASPVEGPTVPLEQPEPEPEEAEEDADDEETREPDYESFYDEEKKRYVTPEGKEYKGNNVYFRRKVREELGIEDPEEAEEQTEQQVEAAEDDNETADEDVEADETEDADEEAVKQEE
jgi:DNA-directed RNA polymerase subunit A"